MTAVQEQDDSSSVQEEKEKKETAPMSPISDVFWFLENNNNDKYLLVMACLFAMCSGLAMPAMAFLFASSFEDISAVSANGDAAPIRELAYYLMVLGVAVFVFMTGQAMLFETVAGRMAERFQIAWFRALLRQDMAYFDLKDVSGTATIVTSHGKRYKKGLGRKLGEGVQFFFTFLAGLGYGFYSSWQVSLLVLTVVPFMAVSTSFLLKMTQSKTARATATYAKAGSLVYTAVSSMRTLLALNAMDELIGSFEAATQEAYEGASSQVVWFGIANGTVMASFLLGYIPVTLYGAHLLVTQLVENGCDPSGAISGVERCDPAGVDIFGALMGITFAGAVLPQVSATLEAFSGARSACHPAMIAIRRTTENNEANESSPDASAPVRRGDSTTALPKYVIDSSASTGLQPKNVQGTIQFENVTFSYPTRQEVNVFSDFSLEIKAGQTVALCGPSGQGKSTVVQLLERFYDPQKGTIKLDGVPLTEWNVSYLREQIGLVSQEPKLFAMSLLDNIRVGCPEASLQEVQDAARQANAHDFISAFSDGYDTEVGDEGAQLSGGQKQRIALARILIQKPKIILLDEATSALDSESEAIVQEALDALMNNHENQQTVLVIAHRLSTIRNADVIAVVQGGTITESGSHAELLAQKGAYHGLIEAQKGNTGDTTDSETDSAPSSRRSSFSGEKEENESPTAGSTNTDNNIIQFSNVHFHYPSRPEQEIFKGLDLAVKEGETLAVVGPSGQGKSTVISLMENFYRPTKGQILFKGVDMADWNIKHLRGELGLVGQEPVLFDISIKDNIIYGYHTDKDGKSITMEDIEAATREANAHDFIMEFPDGYDTIVGSGSSTQVSGGQKQRIAIARALLRKPRVLLLDEATSALDSESERIVQGALDNIMSSSDKTIVVIAHRLSTIRNADRIAVISKGKVRELGNHEELMALPNGHYQRLQQLQDLSKSSAERKAVTDQSNQHDNDPTSTTLIASNDKDDSNMDPAKKEALEAAEKVQEKSNAAKARLLSRGDEGYFCLGAVGAVLAGLMFPGWGFAFAYLIQVLYRPVFPCEDGGFVPDGFDTCDEYYQEGVADEMQDLALKVTYGLIAILVSALIGHTLLHFGFGIATERMNKRVRDAAFKSLVRQEVAYFDLHQASTLTTQISDDAAMIHSFSGEPIRTIVMNLSSVLVGLVVSFYYMWPFALLTLAILPFMAFGAEAEMQMYMGEDEGEEDNDTKNTTSAGGIMVESLTNMKTVASLRLEERRASALVEALKREDPTPLRTNAVKGSTSGLGQFVQMWGIALMFWWGGYLLRRFPNTYDATGFLISMFSLLFSLSGMGIAFQGLTDRDKAKAAAKRIFTLIDRQSEIDPLSDKGRKGTEGGGDMLKGGIPKDGSTYSA